MSFQKLNPYALLDFENHPVVVTKEIFYSELESLGFMDYDLVQLKGAFLFIEHNTPLNQFGYSGDKSFNISSSDRETPNGIILDQDGNVRGGNYLTGKLLPYLFKELRKSNCKNNSEKVFPINLLDLLRSQVSEDLGLESRL